MQQSAEKPKDTLWYRFVDVFLELSIWLTYMGLLGAAIDSFFRWIGHPFKGASAPIWFVILCAVLLPVLLLLARHRERKG
jgi:hypothetical protein